MPFPLRCLWPSFGLSVWDLRPCTTLKQFLNQDVDCVFIVPLIFISGSYRKAKTKENTIYLQVQTSELQALGRDVSLGTKGQRWRRDFSCSIALTSLCSSLYFPAPKSIPVLKNTCVLYCFFSFKHPKALAVFLMRAIGGDQALSYLNHFEDLIKCKDCYK